MINTNYSGQKQVVQRWFVKKVFLKILRNSPENTCAGVSLLIMLQTRGLELY